MSADVRENVIALVNSNMTYKLHKIYPYFAHVGLDPMWTLIGLDVLPNHARSFGQLTLETISRGR